MDSDQRNEEVDMSDGGKSESENIGHGISTQVAPVNLIMEFLGCLMAKDYTSAERLCQMILMYEPNNREALKFQPLIQEKLQLIKDEDDASEGLDDSGDDENDKSDSSYETSSTEECESESESYSSRKGDDSSDNDESDDDEKSISSSVS